MSLTLISLILCLSCFVAGEAFSASRELSSQKNICSEVLSPKPFKDAELKSDKGIVIALKPTVVIAGEQTGAHGGKIKILKRIGKLWHSVHSVGAAIQGDPRTLALILGGELAHFLGLSMIDETTMTAPDSIELNNGIKKLSTKLVGQSKSPIEIQFFDTPGIIDDYTMVRKFFTGSYMPLGVESEIFIHDVSYHIGIIILPPLLIEKFKKVLDVQLKFIEFLKNRLNQAQGTTEIEFYKWLVEANYTSEAGSIDTVMGNTVAYFANDLNDRREYGSNAISEEVEEVLRDEYIGFFGRQLQPTLRTAFAARRYKYAPGSMTREEAMWLENDMNTFIEQNPQIEWDQPLGDFSPNHMFPLISQRIEELKKALAAP